MNQNIHQFIDKGEQNALATAQLIVPIARQCANKIRFFLWTSMVFTAWLFYFTWQTMATTLVIAAVAASLPLLAGLIFLVYYLVLIDLAEVPESIKGMSSNLKETFAAGKTGFFGLIKRLWQLMELADSASGIWGRAVGLGVLFNPLALSLFVLALGIWLIALFAALITGLISVF